MKNWNPKRITRAAQIAAFDGKPLLFTEKKRGTIHQISVPRQEVEPLFLCFTGFLEKPLSKPAQCWSQHLPANDGDGILAYERQFLKGVHNLGTILRCV